MFCSAIRGYHVYKGILDSVVGKHLSCRKDRHNVHDVCAVAVVEGDIVVGVPCSISALCYLFITKGGSIQ